LIKSKKIILRLNAFVLTFLMVFTSSVSTSVFFADDFILTDPVAATYTGRAGATALINAARFADIAGLDGAWPAEAVVRGVALGTILPEGENFRPDDGITRQETLNTIMHAMGLSAQAAARGAEELALIGGFPSAQEMVNLGYATLARDMGILPAGFVLFGQATRQEVAFLTFSAIRVVSGQLDPIPNLVHVYSFADWRTISADYLIAVENLAANNIMNGDGANFMPLSPITRGQMAQILSNLDTILFNIYGIERRIGTIARIRDAELTQTSQASTWQNIFVRVNDGSVEVLQHQATISPSAQAGTLDAVVYRNGLVGGLNLLADGDIVEYFVHTNARTVWYINVLSDSADDITEGQLFAIDRDEMTITLRYPDDSRRIFSLAQGLISTNGNVHSILMDQTRQNIATLPFGQSVRLHLRNNTVVRLEFVGSPVLTEEIRGLVVENNPNFGYMVIINADGRRATMRYYENEMMVQRLSHWDNPLAVPPVTIGEIKPGDIVFIRPDAEDASIIFMISAVSNYIMRFGRIVSIVHHEGYMSVLFEQENGQTSWFEIAGETRITREGRRITPLNIHVGDWARLLVNEAILAPGHTVSSVIEMAVEGDARHISTIIRGNLTGINDIRNLIMLEHVQTLSQVGWVNFTGLSQFSIAGDPAYYYNNRRITRNEALRLFGRDASASVYIALENHFAGPRVSMVSFRTQREERLPTDTVMTADGTGQFWLSNQESAVRTDNGTIVRRHGRLVSGQDILPGDYAAVVLNGANTAAVIDITPRPDTSGLQIMRARLTRVWDGESFRVASMSQLFGNNWVFTPIQREFTIDTRTIFMPYGSYNLDTFLTYTDNSIYDQVFTIVTDGARASHIITQPFANRAVRGTLVNDVAEDHANFMIRDVAVQNPVTNQWHPLSNINNTMDVIIDATTIIGRDNAIVPQRLLQRGDQVLILSEEITITPGENFPGTTHARIILVE
jgi:hypothetical protein